MNSTIATICGSAIEMVICHKYAIGDWSYDKSLMDSPVKSFFWGLFLVHIREPHFYLVHRVMHPWRITWLPDIGKFMYRNFHALHHRSYNPTSFSGTSMHVVEATMYYSAAFLAVPFGMHPIYMLGIIIDCGIGAWLGHAGFVFPGTGDYYHNIHHSVFDCNYGTSNVPLDWFFGTFCEKEEDVKGIWKKVNQKVGNEGNDT